MPARRGITLALLLALASLEADPTPPIAAGPASLPAPPAPAETWLLYLAPPYLAPELGVEQAAAAGMDRGASRLAAYRALEAAGRASLAPLEASLEALLAEGRLRSIERFPALGIVAVTGSADAARQLAARPETLALRPNRWHRLEAPGSWPESQPQPGPPGPSRPWPSPASTTRAARPEPSRAAEAAGPAREANLDRAAAKRLASSGDALAPADEAWHLTQLQAAEGWRRYGNAGEGAVVAVLDTGADWRHPLLRERYRGRDAREQAPHWFDATFEAGSAGEAWPVDSHGHGTHVTGLVAGRRGSEAWGVAPGAEWIAARVFDGAGRSSDLWLLRGAAWVLAPGRPDGSLARPDLAPDVVNGSWSLENGADPLLDRLIETWRAVGIVPVFAAGNIEDLSDRWGRVLAPAGLPGVLGVGAADRSGRAWSGSRSGPGFGEALKPDLLAPGLGLSSAALGGSTREASGSSMAAPQAAGAAALVRSLAPELGVDAVLDLLRHSARDLAPTGPDGASGWGLLDVAAAMEAAASVGSLRGRVLDETGEPAIAARVEASGVGSGAAAPSVVTDVGGRFELALPAGDWRVLAQTPGAVAQVRSVRLQAGRAITTELRLIARPAAELAELSGRVTDAQGRSLAGAGIRLADGRLAVDAGLDGRYRLRLPPGLQRLVAEAPGRRSVGIDLPVTAGSRVRQDFALPAAPSLLLVDADAWDGERIAPYLSRALTDAGYAHALWTVERVDDLPPPDLLAAQDLLIWAHAYGSPGLIDRQRRAAGLPASAVDALLDFVRTGGRLVLSGQDITLHDLQRRLAPDYLRDALGLSLLRSRSWTEPTELAGLGPFQGLRLDLAWPRGSPKLRYFEPDLLAPSGSVPAQALLGYADGGVAALGRADTAARAVFLGFGPESAGDREALAALMDRAIAWLEPPEIALDPSTRSPSPDQPFTLGLVLRGSRAEQPVSLALTLPEGLALIGSETLEPVTPRRLVWDGVLAAGERRRFELSLAIADPSALPEAPLIDAELRVAGKVIRDQVLMRPRLPDLRASRLRLSPARVSAPAPLELMLELDNAGLAAAAPATVRLALPEGVLALSRTLTVESGLARWSSDGRSLRWQGTLAGGARSGLRFALRPAPELREAWLEAEIEPGVGVSLRRGAWLRLGGPELAFDAAMLEPASPAAGETFTLRLGLDNRGDTPADARLALRLPEGVEAADGSPTQPGLAWTAWRGAIAAHAQVAPTLTLRVRPEALAGARALTLTLDDGLLPAAPLTRSLALDIRRADLAASRALLLPGSPRAGDVVTLSLLVANHGNATAGLTISDSPSPALVPLPGSMAVSMGELERLPGLVRWRLELPPAAGSYRIRPPAGDRTMPATGRSLPPIDPDEALAPVDLGLAFPVQTEVYTRAWVSPMGWLALAPPEPEPRPEQGLEGLAVPALAVLWAAEREPLQPRLLHLPDRVVVSWHDAAGHPLATAQLEAAGDVRLRYAADIDLDGARIGFRAADGSLTVISPQQAAAGIDLASAGGWAWLRLASQVGTASDPNRSVGHTLRLEAPGVDRELSTSVTVNRLDLSASRLDAWPAQVLAGSRVAFSLTLAAAGKGSLRDLDARIDLPEALRREAAELVIDPELDYDAAAGALRWRGRLAGGETRRFGWSARLDPALRDGARLVTRLRLAAGGMPELLREQALGVTATRLGPARIRASRSLAGPGQRIDFQLRLDNAGAEAQRVQVFDWLPRGIEPLPDTLWTSQASPPSWDPVARRLSWTGDLAPGSALEIGFGADFQGRSVRRSRLEVWDAAGKVLADWVDILPTRALSFLPSLNLAP
ncbi:MAG: S8 family serine peptidase [Caldilineae bacterium]|nr:S8 family serine peptidase [Caldilineae bacterium]